MSTRLVHPSYYFCFSLNICLFYYKETFLLFFLTPSFFPGMRRGWFFFNSQFRFHWKDHSVWIESLIVNKCKIEKAWSWEDFNKPLWFLCRVRSWWVGQLEAHSWNFPFPNKKCQIFSLYFIMRKASKCCYTWSGFQGENAKLCLPWFLESCTWICEPCPWLSLCPQLSQWTRHRIKMNLVKNKLAREGLTIWSFAYEDMKEVAAFFFLSPNI